MSEFVKYEIKDNTLVLKLIDRVDSKNSAQVEADIEAAKASGSFANVVIDADELNYISSAGLRVVLRVRKEYPGLEIINVNSDVYEIFDMTGFTEMIEVKKGYRKISVEGCEVIGKGSNGEVYRIDPDTIVKVYFNPDCLPDIHRERELARKAFVLGIPTAIPYDVVKTGDTYGSVFELLNAKSFTKILAADPGKIDEVVDMYVELLKTIHSTEVSPDDMPDEKQVVLGWVNDIKQYIAPDKWEKLHALVDAVPENHHIIHGDYHIKNVMLQNGEALLIDMDTLCYGDPVFEFASVFNAYKGFYDGRPAVVGDTFIGIPYDLGIEVFNKTLKGYFGTDDEAFLESVVEKSALVGYTRLLRRTMRRCDMNDPVEKNAVDFYIKSIETLAEKLDTIQF